MKIEIVRAPEMTSYIMFQDFDYTGVKERKHLDITLYMKTKTRVSVSFYDHGKSSHTVNVIPPGSEKFKFHEESSFSYFSGTRAQTQYFVLSKKQGWPELKEHIINLVSYFLEIPKDSDFTINVHKSQHLYTVKSFKDDPQPVGIYA